MPELPEVETIRLGLDRKIVGLTLKKIEVLNPKTFIGGPKTVRGKKVLNVWRRAKILGIDLTGNITLLFHLKMTGQLIFIKSGERLIGGHPTEDMRGQMPNSSTRVIFEFNPLRPRLVSDESERARSEASGSKLFFNDQRKFGWVKVIENVECKIDNLLGKLGPEPLDKSFTWEVLKNNLFRHKNMPVKVALTDQTAVAGIGNIYASECLFLAKIDPRRKVSDLSDEEFKKLHDGIVDSLKLAILKGGSTRAHFVNIDGERGYFLDYANVYGKTGQQCRGCKGKIVKITQAGRGTYFCPNCQK